MVLGVLHGEAGGWDELIIAVVALAVLWIAVKIAGRKSLSENGEADEASLTPRSTPLGVGDSSAVDASPENVSPPAGQRG